MRIFLLIILLSLNISCQRQDCDLEYYPSPPYGNPDYTDYYLFLGNLYKNNLNNNEKAISQYLKIIELEPENFGAYNNAGVFFLDDLQDYEKAEEYLLKGYEIDSDNGYINYNLGRLYNTTGVFEKSIEYFQL